LNQIGVFTQVTPHMFHHPYVKPKTKNTSLLANISKSLSISIFIVPDKTDLKTEKQIVTKH